MPNCPRCGTPLSPIRQEADVARPGGLVEREPTVTGWTCDDDHFLTVGEIGSPLHAS
jgi:hypothetical protein